MKMLVFIFIAIFMPSIASATGEYVTIDKHNPFATGEILVGNYYDRLFRIEIENKDNCNIKDSVTAEYSIRFGDSVIKSDFFTRSDIGCSAYARTGNFTPQLPGLHEICGTVTNSTVSNYSSQICYNITVTGNASQTNQTNQSSIIIPPPAPSSNQATESQIKECDIAAEIISDAFLIPSQNSFSIKINNPSCEQLDAEISIWIKDENGLIVSSETLENSIQCSGVYERKLNVTEGTYIIKTFAEPVSCVDSRISDNLDNAAVIVTSSDYESEDVVTINSPQSNYETSFGSVIEVSFTVYTDLPKDVVLSIESQDNVAVRKSMKKRPGLLSSVMQITLPENCGGEMSSGTYDVKASVGGVQDKISIKIRENAECEKENIIPETNSISNTPITGAVVEKKSGVLDAIISFFKGIFGFFA